MIIFFDSHHNHKKCFGIFFPNLQVELTTGLLIIRKDRRTTGLREVDSLHTFSL